METKVLMPGVVEFDKLIVRKKIEE